MSVNKKTSTLRGMVAAVASIAVVVGMVGVWNITSGLTKWGLEVNLDTTHAISAADESEALEPEASVTPSTEPEVSVTPSEEPEDTTEVLVNNDIIASDMLVQAGFTPSDFVVGDAVDPTLDTGTTGPRSFVSDGIYTAEEQVAFLKSGSPESDAILASIVKDTSTKGYPTTTEDVLDANNWTTVQFTVPVWWTCNSGFDAANKSIEKSDTHADQASSVLAVYIPKEQAASGNLKLAFGTRAACNNPQNCMPTKENPDIPKPKPTPTEKPTTTPTPEPSTEPTPTPTPEPCTDVEKPHDGDHIYEPVYGDDGCIIEWKKNGSSLNDGDQHQDPQDNSTSGVDTGPTTDGNGNPVPEPDPVPTHTGDAPDPNDGGYTSGGGTGTSPGGTTTDSSGTSTSEPTPSNDPVDTGQGGSDNDTMPDEP